MKLQRKRGTTAHHKKREKTTHSTERNKTRAKSKLFLVVNIAENKSWIPSQDSTKFESEIDPMLAAKVVKEYLLPMFKKRQPLTKQDRQGMNRILKFSWSEHDEYAPRNKVWHWSV